MRFGICWPRQKPERAVKDEDEWCVVLNRESRAFVVIHALTNGAVRVLTTTFLKLLFSCCLLISQDLYIIVDGVYIVFISYYFGPYVIVIPIINTTSEVESSSEFLSFRYEEKPQY
jgi:hypothetical protein